MVVSINRTLCESVTSCQENASCIDVCPLNVVRNVNDMIIVGRVCVECGDCISVCPKDAISL